MRTLARTSGRIAPARRNFPSVSSSESLPASTSCITATAVNILFIEPRLNLVSMVLRAPKSLFASPNAAR
jgi:hypothetical protein